MTYNIYDGAASRLDEVIKVINRESPDILVINEANDFDKNNFATLKYFAHKTGFSHYHLERCGDGWIYHVAILSKMPIVSIKPIQEVSRAIIVTEIDVGNSTIEVVGLHLSPFTEEDRVNEIKKLVPIIRDKNNLLIAGDFNSLSTIDKYDPKIVGKFNEGQLKKFTKDNKLRFTVHEILSETGLVDAAGFSNNLNPTVPTKILGDTKHSPVRIDRILFSADLTTKQVSYKVINDALADEASDHYPVVAEFTL